MRKLLFNAVLLGGLLGSGAALAWTAQSTADLNMRTGPGTAYPPILVIPRGALVEVGACNSWCSVFYAGYRGFVSGRFLAPVSGGYLPPPAVIVPPPVVIVPPPVYRPPVYRPPVYRPPVYRPPHYRPPEYRPPVYRPEPYRPEPYRPEPGRPREGYRDPQPSIPGPEFQGSEPYQPQSGGESYR
ncbi:hypothetical protein GWI72_07510 [Microvirga tunisiensis]|uniref:Uncharacterized protein n=2 Tax=Pannonibacter tanglangensis TaxID=2750084 RepID=A0ABW9ZC93_9HYPH|nr:MULTISPECIES: SH3 domain-containing protein [unclassified Pannonibacter]NBN62453.1 hypothetical protein [Pannonibacter sp. XCT-34]NBN78109.1 hypothetical protein [Pannonibacter sp. XCT-53]